MDYFSSDFPLDFCKFTILVSYYGEDFYRPLYCGVQVSDLQKYIKRAFLLAEVKEVLIEYGKISDTFKQFVL